MSEYIYTPLNYETSGEIAHNCKTSKTPYYRTNFDKNYLRTYDTLADKTPSFPSDKLMTSFLGQASPRSLPHHVVENFACFYDVKQLAGPKTSEFWSGNSVLTTEKQITPFDKKYNDFYCNRALNAQTNFASNRQGTNGLFSAN